MAVKQTYEEAITRLEQIVTRLESGQCTLDESLKLFEEGTKLTAFCSRALKTAEQTIIKLTSLENKENRETEKPAESPDAEEWHDMGEELSRE